jgi:membrane-associated PAP2 superfamily phosphatase
MLILGGVALVSTLVFRFTDLDIRVTRLFYVPANPDQPFIHGEFLLWRILYKSDRYLTVTLAVISLSAIVLGIAGRHRRQLLLYGLFIFLTTSLGAGLLVNELFKEHWGRARPDSIEEFGGSRTYIPPVAKGPPGGGNSFASGHASIGFSFMVFWFIWRGRRPRLAAWALVGSIILGSMLGCARIIQGRHFLSDVLWGAYVPAFVCLIFYHYVFKFPRRQHVS